MARQLVADVAGAFERGRQFRQAEELRPLESQSARVELEQQQQNLSFGQRQNEQSLATGELNQESLRQQIDQRTDEQKNKSLFDTALRVNTASDAEIIPILEASIARVTKLGGDPKESIAALELAKADRFEEVRTGAKNLIDIGVRQGEINPEQQKAQADFTLSQGQQRFDASGKLIAQVSPKPSKSDVKTEAVIPQVLLEGLDPELAAKGSAAFTAAGGKKDGLKAFQEIIDKGTEQQRRLASPAILKANFPQASKAEQAQLQGAMDAAKTTESGLKAAQKVRVEQKRLVKAAGFQTRAVDLLNKILDNPELNDVIGSIEGSDESVIPFGGTKVRSDGEANAISDIKESVDILTADNLSLMTGVLSETDIQIIKNLAGGALNRLRSEDRFIEDVTALRDKLSSQKVVTVDERDAAQEPEEGQTATGPNGEKAVLTNGQWVIQDAG